MSLWFSLICLLSQQFTFDDDGCARDRLVVAAGNKTHRGESETIWLNIYLGTFSALTM